MLIYVSGPITIGSQAQHVHNAVKIADAILAMGYDVILPHLDHLWCMISPKPWEVWMKNDLAVLLRCDALFRIPGKSKGADLEEATARRYNMPVYYKLSEIPPLID